MKVTEDEIRKWISQNNTSGEDHKSDDIVIHSIPVPIVRTVPPMIDVKQVAKDFKVTEEEAKVVLDALYTDVKKLLPGETDDVYDYVVMQKIGEKFKFTASGSGLEYAKEHATQYDVTVLAVSKPKDANDMAKRKCWAAFREDPNAAITSGVIAIVKILVANEDALTDDLASRAKYVAVGNTDLALIYRYVPADKEWVNTKYEVKKFDTEKGKTLPLDNKATFENGDVNPNYLNPIAYKRTVDMIVNMNDNIYKAHGNVEGVHIGWKTSFWGGLTSAVSTKEKPVPYKGVIRVWQGAVEENGIYTDAWKDAEELVDTGYFHELSDVRGLPSWGMFATKGYVQKIDVQKVKAYNGDTYKKGAIFITGSDELRGIKFSTSYDKLVEILEDVSLVDEGDEVIITGERASFKNDKGEWLPYNVLTGVIKSKKVNKYADALKKMNAATSS